MKNINTSSASALSLAAVVSCLNGRDDLAFNALNTLYDVEDAAYADVEGFKNLIAYYIADLALGENPDEIFEHIEFLASNGCYVSTTPANEYVSREIEIRTKKGTLWFGGVFVDADAAFDALRNL